MREVEMQVRSGDVEAVRSVVEQHGDRFPLVLDVERGAEPGWRQVRAELPNDRVGSLVDAVARRVEDVHFVLSPGGVLPVREPVGDLRDHVADVSRRSTLELVLDALQSIGSWRGMLLYAFISGLVAAYGVIFDVPYLLTASMLIAPMGAPAMVTVIGVTLGDRAMVRRGTVRFFVALAVAAVAAVVLGLAYGLRVATPTMEAISNLSGWAVLLAVAGGGAGAQALVRSERDSLVTATATGFLVAVALSPPVAVLGLAAAMGRADYAMLMAFNLLLTYFGIVLGGWLSLRFFGVAPGDATGGRGRGSVSLALVAAAVVGASALVGWQHSSEPHFRKADVRQEALRLTRDAVADAPGYRLLDSRADFMREEAAWLEAEGLLVRAVVLPGERASRNGDDRLRTGIARAIRSAFEEVEPFVDLVVVSPDRAGGGEPATSPAGGAGR